MSWFDQIFGPRLTVKVQAPDGSILTTRLMPGRLDAVRGEQQRRNPRVAEVHIFKSDGSYTVWFHHRREDIFTRPRPPSRPLPKPSLSWAPGMKPA